jgi:hypothetical protein
MEANKITGIGNNMKKNVAGQKVGSQMITAADGAVFTSPVTAYVTGDAGTQAIGTVGSGACVHEGNGYHTYAPSQAETNYDLTAFTFIGTGAIASTLQAYNSFPQTVDNNVLAAGATGFAAIDTVVDSILVDTAEIGAAGAGLTVLATAASIAALNDVAATDIVSAGAITTLTGSVASVDLVDVTTTNTDMRGTDSAATATALATVDTVVDGIQTDLSNATDGLGAIKSETALILADTNELQSDDVPGLIGALNNISTAQVNTEVDTALTDYDSATNTEMVAAFTEIKGATFSGASDSLEAIRDRGDAAWTTGAGGSSPTVIQIRQEMDSNSTKLAAIVADTNELQADDIPGRLTTIEGATFSGTTDSLEAIRDRGDAAWTTGAGGSAPTVAQIRTEMDDNSTKLAAIVADTNELQSDDVPGLIAALNNVAATDIVSAGAITTLSGAVVNVDLVDTTTTNTDMRGTNSANTVTPPTATQNADSLLNRDMSAVSDTNARSPLNALRLLRNKWTSSAGTLTVTEEDDTTTAWTATLTGDAAADPVVGSDPA